MYQIEKLANGLRVITQPMPDRHSAAIGVWVGVGGRYEPVQVKGATHFLEHVVFKGSDGYDCEAIKENVEGVGGTLNAFTTEEQTCFYAKVPARHLHKAFDVLTDMVFFPKLRATDVTKEKTVILEEIKMYHDLPQYFVMELLDGLLWPGHALGGQLAGTLESVSRLTARDLRQFHRQYYLPGNVVISVGGEFDKDKLMRAVRRKIGKLEGRDDWSYAPVGDKQAEPRMNFFRKDIEQMHLALGMPGYDENHPDRYALGLLSIILGGNMSSRLFVQVREKKGLAYSIGSYHKTMHDTGVFMIRAGVDNVKIVEAVEVILRELRKIRTAGVTEGEFKRAKDYMIGQIQLGLEDTMEQMLWIGEALISRNKGRTVKDVVAALQKVKPQDLKRVAREILDDQRYNLALVGPITDEQEEILRKLLIK